MEIVNKIQLKLDAIRSSASTINIPFGLDFFPIDNTELQEVEFVEAEKEKAINPIFDHEKYPFYPTYTDVNGINTAYNVEYVITDKNLDFLGLTDEDIVYEREPYKRTYLRLSFFDSRDTKIQKLVLRETVHLESDPSWFSGNTLLDQKTIPLRFTTNFNKMVYRSNKGEGYNFYYYKHDLPSQLYLKISIMNAKTGKVINLYSTTSSLDPNFSKSVAVKSGGYDYIMCDFYYDSTGEMQYYYILNNDGLSDVVNTGAALTPIESINNTIFINLKTI